MLSNTDFAAVYTKTAKKIYNMLVSVFKSSDEAIEVMNRTYLAVNSADYTDEKAVCMAAAKEAFKRITLPASPGYENELMQSFFKSGEKFNIGLSDECINKAYAFISYVDKLKPVYILVIYMRMYCGLEISDIAEAAGTNYATASELLFDAYRSIMPKIALEAKSDGVFKNAPVLQIIRLVLLRQKEAVSQDTTYDDFFNHTLSKLMSAAQDRPFEIYDTAEEVFTQTATTVPLKNSPLEITDVYSNEPIAKATDETISLNTPFNFDEYEKKASFVDSEEWARLKNLFGFYASDENNENLSVAFDLLSDGYNADAANIFSEVKQRDNSAAPYLGLLMVDVNAHTIDELFSIRADYTSMQNYIAAKYRSAGSLKDFLTKLAEHCKPLPTMPIPTVQQPVQQPVSQPVSQPVTQPVEKTKKPVGAIIGIVLTALILVAGIVFFVMFGNFTKAPADNKNDEAVTQSNLYVIESADRYDFQIDSGAEENRIVFQPKKTGYYIIKSSNTKSDFDVSLVDADGKIRDNDKDSGVGNNFMALLEYKANDPQITIKIISVSEATGKQNITIEVEYCTPEQYTAMKKYRNEFGNGKVFTNEHKMYKSRSVSTDKFYYYENQKLEPVGYFYDEETSTLWITYQSGKNTYYYYPMR